MRDWQRVSRRRRCPICDKPDWCLYAGPEHDPTAAICARIESDKRVGEAGWLHRLRDDNIAAPVRRLICRSTASEGEAPDMSRLAEACSRAITPDALEKLAEALGLSVRSLRRLNVGWSKDHRAFTFPMRAGDGRIIGIRLRLPSGRKLSVKGGREGLFIPGDLARGTLAVEGTIGGRLLITEGASDAAALLDLGFNAVGRPSCRGGTGHIVRLLGRLQPQEVVIVADADEPGQRGAIALADQLVMYVPAVRIITPPAGTKDARAWKAAGATAGDVEAAIDAAAVRRLRVVVKRKAGSR